MPSEGIGYCCTSFPGRVPVLLKWILSNVASTRGPLVKIEVPKQLGRQTPALKPKLSNFIRDSRGN
eukprot:3018803-Amphidinium_carterae.1